MLNRLLIIFIIIVTNASCSPTTSITESKNEITSIDNFKTITAFSEAINEYPNDAELYFKRGVLYLESNEFSQAINDFDQAIRLVPEATIVYSFRAKAFFELKKYDKAVSDFTKGETLIYPNIVANDVIIIEIKENSAT